VKDYKIYPESKLEKNGKTYSLAQKDLKKYLLSNDPEFGPVSKAIPCLRLGVSELTHANANKLRKLFPHLTATTCGIKRSFGFGDRLGVATPGHIKTLKGKDIFPVFAQQSIREMERTDRSMEDVLDDAMWGVFQAGYKGGYGADIDHVKKEEDVIKACESGYTMYTIDPSDYVNDKAKDILSIYAGAVEHIIKCYNLIKEKISISFDFEASVDETATPTTPEAHVFIVEELRRAGVNFTSLALRFIGDFEKGIDYIGDIETFKEQFLAHADICQRFGGYKLSIHSGSDKFSIYPIISEATKAVFHIKTAGTNWLEAVRLISHKDPALYRRMHQLALHSFEKDRKSYHVTTNLSKIPALDKLSDEKLPELLNENNSRQLMHITYGSILKGMREEIYKTLNLYEDEHYQMLDTHLGRHLDLAGVR